MNSHASNLGEQRKALPPLDPAFFEPPEMRAAPPNTRSATSTGCLPTTTTVGSASTRSRVAPARASQRSTRSGRAARSSPTNCSYASARVSGCPGRSWASRSARAAPTLAASRSPTPGRGTRRCVVVTCSPLPALPWWASRSSIWGSYYNYPARLPSWRRPGSAGTTCRGFARRPGICERRATPTGPIRNSSARPPHGPPGYSMFPALSRSSGS